MKAMLSSHGFNFLLPGKLSWSSRPPHGKVGIGPTVLGALSFLCCRTGAGRRKASINFRKSSLNSSGNIFQIALLNSWIHPGFRGVPSPGHLDPMVSVRGGELLTSYGVSLQIPLFIGIMGGSSSYLPVGKE